MVEFSTFCPKVLAGIGTLPETVADRSLPIRLERKKRTDEVDRFKQRIVKPAGDALRDQVQGWAGEHREKLAGAIPDMPDEINDRMQEGCEPLVAIADQLGCGREARQALVNLLTVERLDDVETWRVRLLQDIKVIFDAYPKQRAMFTHTLLTQLYAMEEAGWDNYYKDGLDPRDIATLLHGYGISSTTVNIRGQRAKGYKRRDFLDAWERYVD